MSEREPIRLRASQTAHYLHVSRSTLAKWRATPDGPPFHRCGKRLVYYFKHEIDAWLEECDRRDGKPSKQSKK